MFDSGFACIGLTNPKSPSNVGAVMRAAGCYGVNSVFYTGKRFENARKFTTDTKKVYQNIPLIGTDSLSSVLPLGATPVAIELIEGAKPLTEYKHPKSAFYMFGPEDGSLDKETLKLCQDVIYVPTQGCMNLAATVNVILYDRLLKSGLKFNHDEIIRSSRDNNNNIVLSELLAR
ncbi:RNA methyltransferase [Pseudoalteromonas sp. MMG022]|uniref:RNA methyltransferase n=1 Tax=Pseudoalteromonas sp. MMG022 TaxID=2909978 RepID=UPI001F2E958E|nr:RNA methyltransferase [Pseudoalteromonas sp. MMG022]MCF6434442.1 RNA methyltransferase [Pseudoalteromonas sp. MMG022]